MGTLSIAVGILDALGRRIDAARSDGTFVPWFLQLGPGLSGAMVDNGSTKTITISAETGDVLTGSVTMTDATTAVPIVFPSPLTVPINTKATFRIHVDALITEGAQAAATRTIEAPMTFVNLTGTAARVASSVPGSSGIIFDADETAGGGTPIGGLYTPAISGSTVTLTMKGAAASTTTAKVRVEPVSVTLF